jgi:hypothetical protein
MSGFVLIALMVAGQEGETTPFFDGPPPRLEERQDTPPPGVPAWEFPKLMSVLDLDRWRESEDLLLLRQRAGDAVLGVPLFVPQLLVEEFMPRGLAVGPTTFLYRDTKDSKGLSLVVFDQALFHEAEFLQQAQARGDDTAYTDSLSSSQTHVLRRSLMTGFKAAYSLPNMTLDAVRDTAEELGFWGYLLGPSAAGGLLVLKGLDQKISVDDVLQLRVKVSCLRQWTHGLRTPDGVPALSAEIRLWRLPLAVIFSLDTTSHGMAPQFVGLGTTLDVVEDLLVREETRNLRPNQ